MAIELLADDGWEPIDPTSCGGDRIPTREESERLDREREDRIRRESERERDKEPKGIPGPAVGKLIQFPRTKYTLFDWRREPKVRLFAHHCLAHPFMAMTNGARWAIRFHDATEDRAALRVIEG